MFARVKKSGRYQYLQIVENRKENGKVKQTVISNLGRMDPRWDKEEIQALVETLSKISGQFAPGALSEERHRPDGAEKIGPALIFERLWKKTGLYDAVKAASNGRKFQFDLERAVFLSVLHQLMAPGSDRHCIAWKAGYRIHGAGALRLHHLYRAMAFLGKTWHRIPFMPCPEKECHTAGTFSSSPGNDCAYDIFIFDVQTSRLQETSMPLLAAASPETGRMLLAVLMDDRQMPVCCQMWPGETWHRDCLSAFIDDMRHRFSMRRFFVVSHPDIIDDADLAALGSRADGIGFVLGSCFGKSAHLRKRALSCPGRYARIDAVSGGLSGPVRLKAKAIVLDGARYIFCINEPPPEMEATRPPDPVISSQKNRKKQANGFSKNGQPGKDALGDTGFSRPDLARPGAGPGPDDKWLIATDTALSASRIALKYHFLLQLEAFFRGRGHAPGPGSNHHHSEGTFRGHVLCQFMALVLRKTLEGCLSKKNLHYPWPVIAQHLNALEIFAVEHQERRYAVRTPCSAVCRHIFQCTGVVMPAPIAPIG